MNIAELTFFFGYMTVINVGLLIFTAIVMMVFKDIITKIHSKIFDIPKEDLNKIYFNFLGYYKGLIIVFNAVPYIALLCFNLK